MKTHTLNSDTEIYGMLDDLEKHGNFNAFLNLCFLDLTVLKKNFLSTVHIWDEIYNLRQGYLLIYEALRTFQTHSKHLKDLASRTSQEAIEYFGEITKQLKEFRKDYQYEKKISQIRNHTIGHIESDHASLFEKITNIDDEKAYAALNVFGAILARMLKLSDYIFLNYTKSVAAKYSFQVTTMNTYSEQITDLLNLLESNSFNNKFNGG